MPYLDRYRDEMWPDRSDVYRHSEYGKGMFSGSSSSSYGGLRQFRFDFENGEAEYVYLECMDLLYDARIRKRDQVDIRREDGIVLRGTVVEIDAEKDKPYLISGRAGESVWMAAHEFERFVRADAAEKAYYSLKEVRARIEVLETELRALKITEEVLEGVYT